MSYHFILYSIILSYCVVIYCSVLYYSCVAVISYFLLYQVMSYYVVLKNRYYILQSYFHKRSQKLSSFTGKNYNRGQGAFYSASKWNLIKCAICSRLPNGQHRYRYGINIYPTCSRECYKAMEDQGTVFPAWKPRHHHSLSINWIIPFQQTKFLTHWDMTHTK